jgi:hypothetical protein
MRLKGPINLAQIARFLRTQFSSDRTGSMRRASRSLWRFILVRSAVFLLGAAILFPTLVHAQRSSTSRKKYTGAILFCRRGTISSLLWM